MCTGWFSARLAVECRITVKFREVTCFDVIAKYYPIVPTSGTEGPFTVQHARTRVILEQHLGEG
jgi:hypothetical protein